MTARGEFVLRPEQPDDEAFLFRLFVANNSGILHQAGIAQDVIDNLIAFQYRSQTATYRGLYPDAVFSIVEFEGKPVGRFIEQDEQDLVYIVQIALLPERQAKGLGTALTRALMQEWAAHGGGSRAKVMMNNEPSLKMFRKLGFVETGPAQGGYLDLVAPITR